jgi:hypothetical protein
LIFLGL